MTLREILGEIVGTLAILAVLVGAALIHDPETNNITVEVNRK